MTHENQTRNVISQHRPRPGAPPGTLVSNHTQETSISVIGYSKDKYSALEDVSVNDIKAMENDFEVIWVNLVGLANVNTLTEIGSVFGIHHLTLEDILNTHQRAKFEAFDTYDFMVMKMAGFANESKSNEVMTAQLNIVLKEKFVFTFQIANTGCLQPVRRRIEETSGLIRDHKADYLVYALVDSVIDHYFPVLDRLSDCVADFDDGLIVGDNDMSLKEVHELRRELLHLSRSIRPNREMLSRLMHESSRFSEATRVFLGDCFDHALQLSESIDVNRDICSELRSYHLALVGQRTNDVMKTLTIVSTIFIPLSFIAGLYGMNFDNMPELHWQLGYFGTLFAMVSIAVGLLLWFRKKGWFKKEA